MYIIPADEENRYYTKRGKYAGYRKRKIEKMRMRLDKITILRNLRKYDLTILEKDIEKNIEYGLKLLWE